jgi:hypothetical protein
MMISFLTGAESRHAPMYQSAATLRRLRAKQKGGSFDSP